MNLDVLELTQELIAIESPSQRSNAEIAEELVGFLIRAGFDVERLEYLDHGESKVSLVAKKGDGDGGLCLFSHSDTVPGDEGWEPFSPKIEGNRLIGRGSADMKGPLAGHDCRARRQMRLDSRSRSLLPSLPTKRSAMGGQTDSGRVAVLQQRLARVWRRGGTDGTPPGLRAQRRTPHPCHRAWQGRAHQHRQGRLCQFPHRALSGRNGPPGRALSQR
ncbi:MAG: M20/M25/M40 family metallo-hydrolase [Caldilineaceae bacterium]|nr:M20/M25/M40 family metallo-hydrolase [Caldilineaceae bacterium]